MNPEFFFVCEKAARTAGELLREMLGTITVRHKKNFSDLVTEADFAAQETIETILLDAFPEHGFLGEEGNLTRKKVENAEYLWIVDPLDGTTNFVHGVPLFCTSIALARGQEILCAVIYNPLMDELYSAEKGKGARLNGQAIRTSSWQTLAESLVSVSFPTITRETDDDLRAFLKTVPICQAIRRTGSTALNLAYVAAGRFDAAWSYQCHPWDMAAGALLVQEAGGRITRPDGKTIDFRTDPAPYCAVANTTLHNELIRLLNP